MHQAKCGMRVLFFACVACVASACAGDLVNPDRFAFLVPDAGTDAAAAPSNVAPAPACVTALFAKSCAGAACHSPPALQVDLTSPGVERRLVGKASPSTSVCNGHVFVASDGTQSLLLQKLTAPPPCGAAMPFGGTPVSASDLACVRDWVATLNGAGSDGGGAPPRDGGP